jgi:hypothetical protein
MEKYVKFGIAVVQPTRNWSHVNRKIIKISLKLLSLIYDFLQLSVLLSNKRYTYTSVDNDFISNYGLLTN